MEKSAVISDCQQYRYRLSRVWDRTAQSVLFIMLNPSTADASVDDPTIRRCMGFAKSWGFGALYVGNLFAYRATDPKQLKKPSDPVGPENNDHLLDMARTLGTVVCAWGRHGTLFRRDERVLKLFRDAGIEPKMLAKVGKNYPMHPLYLPAELQYVGMP